MKHPKSSLAILFSVIVLDLIGFGVVIPILPFYAETYGANAFLLGLLLTSYASMQFLFSPLWGKLSDKIGRKKVLLLTMAGSVVGLTILGLAPNLIFLFVGRIVSGIFGANISVATAYVTDVTTEENRTKGMGLIGVAFGIGFILGPAIAALLLTYGYSVPIFAVAGLGVFNILYASLRLGESNKHQASHPLSWRKILEQPAVRKMCGLNLIYTLGITQLETTLAFFMMDRFQFTKVQFAILLVLIALILVAVQGGLIRRLVPRFGEKNLLLAGGMLLMLSFLCVPSIYTIAILLIPLSVASLGRGISQPSLLSLVSKSAPKKLRGGVMGTFQSSASLARVIGPVTAGFLYDRGAGSPLLLRQFFVIGDGFDGAFPETRSHEKPGKALTHR